MPIEHKPWGWYENLHESSTVYKVKRLFVSPNKKISLQYHLKRSEHWIIVEGSGIITLGNNIRSVTVGDYIHIPLEAVHRIEGGDEGIMIVEIQQGSLCEETDIIRLQDDYNRI